MYSQEQLLEMLSSDHPSVRYEACEELRVRQESSPEIINALVKAIHDEESWVEESAKLALQADAHHQMAIKLGIITPDKMVRENDPSDLPTAPKYQENHPEYQEQSTQTIGLNDFLLDEQKSSLHKNLEGSSYPRDQKDSKPQQLNRNEKIVISIGAFLVLSFLAIATLLTINFIPRIRALVSEFYINRGLEFYANGDLDNAINEYNKAIQLDPNNPAAYLDRGLAYYDKDDLDRAISDYNYAITLDPNIANAFFYRGIVYYDKDDMNHTISDMNLVIQLNPDYVDAYNFRGIAYAKKNDLDHAISDWDKALQINPDYVYAYFNRAIAYYNEGEMDLAIRDWNQVIRLDPNNSEAFMNRGTAYNFTGEIENAIGDFNRVLDLCGDNTTLCQAAREALLPLSDHVTEVTIWSTFGTSQEGIAFSKVISQAVIDFPQYKITVVQVPFSDIFNKYRTDVAAGGGPDMFIAPNDYLGDYVRSGLISDITDLAYNKLTDYSLLSIEGMKLDGKLYGIPESFKAVVFWYDKTKITTPPATTDELKKMMVAGTPIGISFGCYHSWGFYNAFGGKIFDEDWNIVADQGTGITNAMTYLNDLYQIAKTNGWPRTDSNSLAPFTEGKLYAIINGNWAMGDYYKKLGEKLGIAPLPSGPGGVAKPLLGVDGYYINPNSQDKEAAIEIALNLTSGKAEIELMKAGHLPAITTVTITDPYLLAIQEAFKNGYIRPQVPQMDNYLANFCNMNQVFVYGVDPVIWVQEATTAANR